MRIIAGTLKGRRLKSPTWDGLRPTSDRLRETLFNILAPRMQGARVLDMFAGTGALGIEAMSRGASSVTFIEGDWRAQALIAENLAHCGMSNGCVIIRASVVRGLSALGAEAAAALFDIVLLDPPYDQRPDAILTRVSAFVVPGGLVVLEHAKRQPAPDAVAGLIRTRQVRSGNSMLSIYERET